MKKVILQRSTATKSAPAKDVDAYLSQVPPEARRTLAELRKAIKAAAPKAEEVISYRIPTYKHHGPLVHFMAHPNHCSFVTASRAVLKTLKREVEDFDTSGTTIHFSAEHPLPATLVKKIVKARMKENEAKARNR
jgi:uncharacterized protein YdhG (YjbR/CyaY superfamily)